MDVSRVVSEGIKVWIAGGGVVLALCWSFVPRRVAVGLLTLLAAVSVGNYARWGPNLLVSHVDTYDLVHYYLNAKYFDELGYLDLYPAVMYADFRNGGPHFPKQGDRYMAQDEHGHFFASVRTHGLPRGAEVAEAFGPERWAEFEHDALVLQRDFPGMNDRLWRQLIQDHGYNATPVWTMAARPLAEAVPVESIKWLCHLDTVLLAAAVGAVVWAYGSVAGLWTVLFFMLSYSLRWPTISWAFLRYDYLAALVIAMACLRKNKPLLAGLLTGYSAALRFFPAMWLFGPGAKGFFGLLRKKVHVPMLVMLGGFLLGMGGLQVAATGALGSETVRTHFENMLDHNSAEQLSSRRIGLALALPFAGPFNEEPYPDYIEASRKDTIEDQKPLRFAIAGAVMLVMGFAMRHKDDDEVFAYGFVPFFLLTTASYYYYVARVTLVVLHGSRLDRWRHRIGLASIVGLELFSNWAETARVGERVFHIGWLSWGLCAYVAVQTLWMLAERRGEATPAGR